MQVTLATDSAARVANDTQLGLQLTLEVGSSNGSSAGGSSGSSPAAVRVNVTLPVTAVAGEMTRLVRNALLAAGAIQLLPPATAANGSSRGSNNSGSGAVGPRMRSNATAVGVRKVVNGNILTLEIGVETWALQPPPSPLPAPSNGSSSSSGAGAAAVVPPTFTVLAAAVVVVPPTRNTSSNPSSVAIVPDLTSPTCRFANLLMAPVPGSAAWAAYHAPPRTAPGPSPPNLTAVYSTFNISVDLNPVRPAADVDPTGSWILSATNPGAAAGVSFTFSWNSPPEALAAALLNLTSTTMDVRMSGILGGASSSGNGTSSSNITGITAGTGGSGSVTSDPSASAAASAPLPPAAPFFGGDDVFSPPPPPPPPSGPASGPAVVGDGPVREGAYLAIVWNVTVPSWSLFVPAVSNLTLSAVPGDGFPTAAPTVVLPVTGGGSAPPLLPATAGNASSGGTDSTSGVAAAAATPPPVAMMAVETRPVAAPPTGVIRLAYDNECEYSAEIDVYWETSDVIGAKLAALPGLTKPRRSGRFYANDTSLHITFQMDPFLHPGDQPRIRIADTRGLSGEATAFYATSDYAGSNDTLYFPLPVDFMRLTVGAPNSGQLTVNGVSAACAHPSGVCGFAYDGSATGAGGSNGTGSNSLPLTPAVVSVEPIRVTFQPPAVLSKQLVITGSGFTPSTQANASIASSAAAAAASGAAAGLLPADTLEVRVGGAPCVVTAATDTTITCNLTLSAPAQSQQQLAGQAPPPPPVPSLAAGLQPLTVYVPGKGRAAGAPVLVVDALVVTSVWPQQVSMYGATLIRIGGHGFVSSASISILSSAPSTAPGATEAAAGAGAALVGPCAGLRVRVGGVGCSLVECAPDHLTALYPGPAVPSAAVAGDGVMEVELQVGTGVWRPVETHLESSFGLDAWPIVRAPCWKYREVTCSFMTFLQIAGPIRYSLQTAASLPAAT